MSARDDPIGFYDEAYRPASAEESDRGARWRALGARAKADHVVELAGRIGLRPQRVAEVGCGDGALLSELAARGFAPVLAGFEISEPAVAIARERSIPGLESITLFDGERLGVADGTYDLGVLSHVLEHVPEPARLLAETARACGTVIVEVPLEANLSARRGSKREGADEIGHLQRLDRAEVAAFVRDAGLRIAADLSDPLTFAAHSFFATSASARAGALAKAGVRRTIFRASRRAAERVFTVHYACACVPA